MKEQQFKKIATLFSFVFAFDIVILPSVIAVITAFKNDAEYNLLLEAFLIYFGIFLVLGLFWIVGLYEIYAVFFLDEKGNQFFLTKLFNNLIKKGYRNNQLSRTFLILQTVLIWGGLLYVFLYEIYKVFELLL